MAANDILPYTASGGGHGRIITAPLDASSTHLRGEPVLIDEAGQVSIAGNDPNFAVQGAGAIGIAMVGAQQIADASGDGTIANSENQPVQICVFDNETEFFTRNMSDNGTAIVFTITDIGDECNLELVGSAWGIDTTTTRTNFKITGLLDDDGRDAIIQSTTVTGARFRRLYGTSP